MKRSKLLCAVACGLFACSFLGSALQAAPDPTSPAAASGELNALLNQLHSGSAASGGASAGSGDDFLPPERAFQFSAAPDRQSVQLTWVIAPGYYLYRDRIHVESATPTVGLGAVKFPPGVVKNDEYFGKQVIYHQELVASVPLLQDARAVTLRVTYQGCAEAGLCYPPMTRTVSLTLPPAGAAGSPAAQSPAAGAPQTSAPAATPPSAGYVSEQDRLALLIRSGNILGVLATFWALGLLLAFTPCCLPMVPILSGLIAGSGPKTSGGKAFALSLTYVLGMAITYTATGAAFAAAGKQVQAAFQQTWIVVLFAALFVVMALSMFGLFTVQMPAVLQTRLAAASNRQRAGHFGGVALMGALSALIVTTCVAPPLVATLAVIGQSGAIVRGSAALFAMSLGMGAPLLVVGSSAGRWLPKAGAWMDSVKRLFGVLMLALAAWMLTRVVPARATLLLFAVPAIGAAVVLWQLARMRSAAGAIRGVARLGALAAAAYAVLLMVGAGLGAQDPLQPLARSRPGDDLAFYSISSVSQLDRQVQLAAAEKQAVMLDFYADWCTSCKEMQHYTFTDPAVRGALRQVRLLRADVTANNADDQALLQRFHIFGPPTIAFYDDRGHERSAYRVVGYMSAPRFAALIHQALTSG